MRRGQPRQRPSWPSITWPSMSSSRRPASRLAPSGETWDFSLTLPSSLSGPPPCPCPTFWPRLQVTVEDAASSAHVSLQVHPHCTIAALQEQVSTRSGDPFRAGTPVTLPGPDTLATGTRGVGLPTSSAALGHWAVPVCARVQPGFLWGPAGRGPCFPLPSLSPSRSPRLVLDWGGVRKVRVQPDMALSPTSPP